MRLCAAAIADWVKQTEGADQRGVVVGHDRRFMSEQFAAAVVETLLGQGVRVLSCDHGPVPTPVVTFTVPHTQAAAGVMVTASHNPAIYNGIKVKTSAGAPADRIVNHRDRDLRGHAPPERRRITPDGAQRAVHRRALHAD